MPNHEQNKKRMKLDMVSDFPIYNSHILQMIPKVKLFSNNKLTNT